METGWERTLPFVQIERIEIEELFKGVLEKNNIKEISLINEGCRTTNYIIKSTLDKQYILKIFYEKSDSYEREIKLFKMLEGKINISHIYKFDKSEFLEGREYTIYGYLDGETLSNYIQNGNKLNNNMVKQAAFTLANIHNNKYKQIGFLNKDLSVQQELPPLIEWYKMFMGKNAQEKMGIALKEKILNIVETNKRRLIELDTTASLVHGDFSRN